MNKRGLPETIRMRHDLHYVDELFRDESGAIGRYIPIDQIKPNPNQPRQSIGDLTELAASIREKGVLEPLLVRPVGNEFEIIAGERRWRACKEVGLSKIPCIEKDVSDREMLELALIENLQRKDLTAFEEAEGLKSLGERFGYTHAEIAQVVGKSRTSVTEVLSLNLIPEEIREMCRLADINSKSLLLEIVRQPGIPEMKELISRIERQQLTRQDVRDEAGRGKSKSKPFVFTARGEDYKLSIQFQKSRISDEEVIAALKETLDKLK